MATNLVRFIVQECNEAIIAAYLYKGLDTQTSGEKERTLNLASSAAALVTTPLVGRRVGAGNCG